MKNITIFIIIQLFYVMAIPAQTVLHGLVRSKNNKPISALVTLSPKGTSIIVSFADADKNGAYRINYDGQADSLVLNVSSLEYGTASKIVKNQSQKVDFILGGKAFELKEVVVKADKIRESGDTISYNVTAYKSQGDRVIGDVLKKMPGIEVKNGRIRFNGQDIKKFYIENMDLLQQRYGIATNNVSANDVASVQIYQNHQPIRALKDINPKEDVAINLTLKKEAKGTLAMNAMLGIGEAEAGNEDRLLLAGELTAMYFGKKYQLMTLYKGNNLGNDVEQEVRQQGDMGAFYATPPISLIGASVPNVSKKRYLQNRSHVLSSNHAIKVDSLRTLVLNCVYSEDRQLLNSDQISDYYLASGGRLCISETTNLKKYVHHLEGALNYKLNSATTYLENHTDVDINWNHSEAFGLMSSGEHSVGQSIGQSLKSPKLSVENKFDYIHRIGKRSYGLKMMLGFDQKPYQLDYDSLSQGYMTRTIAAKLSTKFGWKWGVFNLDYMLTGNMEQKKVETDLQGMNSDFALSDKAFSNDYSFNRYGINLEQWMRLGLHKWYFSFNLPVSWEGQYLNDELMSMKENWSNVFLRPSLEIKYIIGKYWIEWLNSYYSMIDNAGRVGRGLVMRNYRTFQKNEIEDANRQRTFNSSLKFYYKDAYQQMFFNASASWIHVRNNTVMGVEYENDQTVCRVIPMPNDHDSYRLTGEFNKGFDFWKSTFKIFGNYSLAKYLQLIQQQPTAVHAKYWSASAYVFASPTSWLYFAASYAFGQSKSYVENAKNAPCVNNSTTNFNVSITPVQSLILSFSVEDNYNNLTERERHCWFGDAKVVFKARSIDYELTVGNIFNRKSYTRITYSGLDIFTRTTQLRSRNIVGTVRFKIL